MLYGNNEAREIAKKELARLYVKIANVKPSDDLTRDDIRSIMLYMSHMEHELDWEIKRNKTAV